MLDNSNTSLSDNTETGYSVVKNKSEWQEHELWGEILI